MTARRSTRRFLASVTSLLLCVSAAEPGFALTPAPPYVTYRLTPVITSGLDRPVFITHAGDSRLFIVEQGGKVRIWRNGVLLSTPFLDISNIVKCCGEEGLLGLAFEPGFATSGRFYVYYTDLNGDQVVARYAVSSNPDVADPSTRQVVLKVSHPAYSNHNGGWIGFGPDNYLYVSVGDGGGAGDPFCAGQNVGDLRGKILRLDVIGQFTYTIPSGNVFTPTQRPEVWAYGLRNPWRASFDRLTGAFFIADVGQASREEINFLPPNAVAGADFGWSTYEGSLGFSNGCPKKTAGVTFPVAEYDHSLGCSVTGGYVYRGQRYPFLHGTYFYGDFCSGRIWAMWSPNGSSPFISTVVIDTSINISTFGEDAQGEIYLASYFDDAIYRLDAQRAVVWLPIVQRQE